MSSDETPNVPTPSHSRAAVREKAQQVNAQQSRARIMRRVILGLVAVVIVGAAGGAVAWAVGSAVSKPSLSPSNLKDDGVLVTKGDLAAARAASAPTPTPTVAGSADPSASSTPTPDPTSSSGPVDIHVYVDYLSPGAGDFERANAKQLATWVDQDAATVTYHPVALLTANSNGTKYSLRAASAAACVAARQPDVFYAFNHALLIDQPKQDTDGKSDKDLIQLAVDSGVKDTSGMQGCIEDSTYDSWVKDVTQRAVDGPLPGSKKAALTGAPTIVVNGQVYAGSLTDAAEFSQFVLSVASDSYYGTPGPTVTPTPSPTATP
ncbi:MULTISPECIES: DsbA family protein [unclassified Microbacterium]|uniref:DsbA family protein n=1 Tax=unclassified Microbacterium TaxID=2609290 RepID=UPI001AD08407|nr:MULTISPECIES: thioredoxin domain-containing protein [unclassified Microbacterium]MBN9157448.1 thioredoxin domain-containing protein [Microbacterium sp.]MBS1897112.1 thioredoxin domain-containing protein [Actinomycetota bacterium]